MGASPEHPEDSPRLRACQWQRDRRRRRDHTRRAESAIFRQFVPRRSRR